MIEILLDIDNLPFQIDNETYFIIEPNTLFMYQGNVRVCKDILIVYRMDDILRTVTPPFYNFIKSYKNLIEYPNSNIELVFHKDNRTPIQPWMPHIFTKTSIVQPKSPAILYAPYIT